MKIQTSKYEEGYNFSFFVNYNVQQHKIFRNIFEDHVREINDGINTAWIRGSARGYV
jgi:malate synthase